MEYQKIINLLDNTSKQPSKFRTKNWVEVNDDARRTQNTNNQIKCKTSILKSSLCDYSDAYILVKGIISIASVPLSAANQNNNDKEVLFRKCAPFTDCINEINNTHIDNAKDNGGVLPMYNLIKYGKNYSKTSVSLWQYYRDESFLDYNDAIANFPAASNNSISFQLKQKITGKTDDGGTTDV